MFVWTGDCGVYSTAISASETLPRAGFRSGLAETIGAIPIALHPASESKIAAHALPTLGTLAFSESSRRFGLCGFNSRL